jgi:hypothetical protein
MVLPVFLLLSPSLPLRSSLLRSDLLLYPFLCSLLYLLEFHKYSNPFLPTHPLEESWRSIPHTPCDLQEGAGREFIAITHVV